MKIACLISAAALVLAATVSTTEAASVAHAKNHHVAKSRHADKSHDAHKAPDAHQRRHAVKSHHAHKSHDGHKRRLEAKTHHVSKNHHTVKSHHASKGHAAKSHRASKNHHKSHQRHAQKFKPTRIVADYDNCNDRDGKLAICATAGFECRIDPEQPQIEGQPPNDPICMPAAEGSALANSANDVWPWLQCVNGQDGCAFNFECICDDVEGQNCSCRPPDAVRMTRATDDGSAPPCGPEGCFDHQYCKYQEYAAGNGTLIAVCGIKPYYFDYRGGEPSSSGSDDDEQEYNDEEQAAQVSH